MGLVLLLLGAGSIVAIPLAANLSARFTSKQVVLSGGLPLGYEACELRLIAVYTRSKVYGLNKLTLNPKNTLNAWQRAPQNLMPVLSAST